MAHSRPDAVNTVFLACVRNGERPSACVSSSHYLASIRCLHVPYSSPRGKVKVVYPLRIYYLKLTRSFSVPQMRIC